MKKLFILLAGVSMAAAATAQSWTLDKTHSSINFSVSHMVVSEATGNFKDFSGEVKSEKSDFSDLGVNFTIKVASINTDDEKRDGHLKSPDFFDAAKFPDITFKSTNIKKINDKKYELTGDLTMKGVTKKVTWEVKYNGTVKDPYGNNRAGFKATTTVDRKDYGVSWNKTLDAGGVAVGDDVTITVNAELVKK
ncbi:MAG: polyisoprenoid-binding protein [Bacteroidetes bacterium]|nr:polyisoprenoid-binding protein [Bacteroidota bacterium]